MGADIHGVDTVFSKLLKLRFRETVTARTGDAEHIDIVVKHSRVCLSILFEDIGRFEIFANVFEHRDSLLINSLRSRIVGFKCGPFFSYNFKCVFYGIVFTNDTKVTEETTDLLLKLC